MDYDQSTIFSGSLAIFRTVWPVVLQTQILPLIVGQLSGKPSNFLSKQKYTDICPAGNPLPLFVFCIAEDRDLWDNDILPTRVSIVCDEDHTSNKFALSTSNEYRPNNINILVMFCLFDDETKLKECLGCRLEDRLPGMVVNGSRALKKRSHPPSNPSSHLMGRKSSKSIESSE